MKLECLYLFHNFYPSFWVLYNKKEKYVSVDGLMEVLKTQNTIYRQIAIPFINKVDWRELRYVNHYRFLFFFMYQDTFILVFGETFSERKKIKLC